MIEPSFQFSTDGQYTPNLPLGSTVRGRFSRRSGGETAPGPRQSRPGDISLRLRRAAMRKASGFPALTARFLFFSSAGRLSLPAEEGGSQGSSLRKGGAFPPSSAAEPLLSDFDAAVHGRARRCIGALREATFLRSAVLPLVATHEARHQRFCESASLTSIPANHLDLLLAPLKRRGPSQRRWSELLCFAAITMWMLTNICI